MLALFAYLGTGVFAVSGALAAARKSFDLLGIVVIAFVTAIGGGTVRDLLLDRHPIFWVREPRIGWVILGSAFLTLLFIRFRKPPKRALLYADALGLALFTISGAQIAEGFGLPALTIVMMATITGSAGGVLRDVLSAEVPLLFRQTELYATASIAGTAGYLLLESLGVDREAAAWMGMTLVAALRFTAIRYGLKLPVFQVPG
jgi:uncharacterized membrane protein YeiH